ncbi:MAG TPA: hypothetical protein VGT05_00590 [Patescibacteria group bacterium]|nr:hypothetical protein [Patescibacteria group bacterium]
MRKILLVIGFFSVTPLFLVALGCFLFFSSQQHQEYGKSLSLFYPANSTTAYAALPGNVTMNATIGISDARVGKVLNFLQTYDSPLIPYANLIVTDADRYGIDYRLPVAIAMQESLLCRREISGTHNCWGFGIYGGKVTKFSSYQEAIDTITRYFAKKKDNGMNTVEQIGNIYNPTDFNNWKANVSSFMSLL